ncbi:BAI1-associated protein 3 [Bienertia sinuspersici]
MAYDDQDYYSSSSEKKWKLFKKESSKSSSFPVDSSLMRSYSHKNTSSKSPPFVRSFSQKPSSKLSRTSSMKSSCPSSPTSTKNKSNLVRNFSKKSSAFGKKCTHLAKEQKARFYIMKRCVSMLVSWPKKGDS